MTEEETREHLLKMMQDAYDAPIGSDAGKVGCPCGDAHDSVWGRKKNRHGVEVPTTKYYCTTWKMWIEIPFGGPL